MRFKQLKFAINLVLKIIEINAISKTKKLSNNHRNSINCCQNLKIWRLVRPSTTFLLTPAIPSSYASKCIYAPKQCSFPASGLFQRFFTSFLLFRTLCNRHPEMRKPLLFTLKNLFSVFYYFFIGFRSLTCVFFFLVWFI